MALAVGASGLLIAASPADAQWRGYRGGYHHGGYHRGGGYYGGGAALGGFAAGAILGGALAARPYYGGPGYYAYDEGDGDVGYCMSRFKSYDPQSGTYLGYDGYRHPCP
ncbi:MAG: BA14K family protein [Pseudolabrys sp.]